MTRWRNLVTVALLSGLWLLLTDGDPTSWIIGVPVILGAYLTMRRLGSVHTALHTALPSLLGVLYFMPFFLWESLRGGVDVALRTLTPRMRVDPGFCSYPIRLQRHEARLLFANCVSLLPGTLAADLVNNDRLTIHLLDTSADSMKELQRLERAVGRVYRDAVPHAGDARDA